MRTIAFRLSLVLIFMVPWEGMIEFRGLGTAVKLMGMALALCWAAAAVMAGRVRKPTSFLGAMFLFVLWIALSVLWSADPARSLGHVWTWVQSLILALILWDLYRTKAEIMAGLQAYVFGAYVAVGGAIINYFSGQAFYSHYDRFSPGETNPDGFGFIIAMGVPVAWYLAASRSPTRFLRVTRVVNYAYIPAAFLGLALSGTRTATVAAMAGMAFGLVALGRLKPLARIAVILVLGVAIYQLLPIVAPLRSFQRLGTTTEEATEGDWNGRLLQWQQGLESFQEHPLVGVGAYMYPSINTLGKAAHNTFVAILVELGVIGILLFGLIVAIAVASAFSLHRWDRGFWLTLLLVWGIGSSTLTWGHRTTTWLFLTLVVASAAVERAEQPAVQPRPARALAVEGGWSA